MTEVEKAVRTLRSHIETSLPRFNSAQEPHKQGTWLWREDVLRVFDDALEAINLPPLPNIAHRL